MSYLWIHMLSLRGVAKREESVTEIVLTIRNEKTCRIAKIKMAISKEMEEKFQRKDPKAFSLYKNDGDCFRDMSTADRGLAEMIKKLGHTKLAQHDIGMDCFIFSGFVPQNLPLTMQLLGPRCEYFKSPLDAISRVGRREYLNAVLIRPGIDVNMNDYATALIPFFDWILALEKIIPTDFGPFSVDPTTPRPSNVIKKNNLFFQDEKLDGEIMGSSQKKEEETNESSSKGKDRSRRRDIYDDMREKISLGTLTYRSENLGSPNHRVDETLTNYQKAGRAANFFSRYLRLFPTRSSTHDDNGERQSESAVENEKDAKKSESDQLKITFPPTIKTIEKEEVTTKTGKSSTSSSYIDVSKEPVPLAINGVINHDTLETKENMVVNFMDLAHQTRRNSEAISITEKNMQNIIERIERIEKKRGLDNYLSGEKIEQGESDSPTEISFSSGGNNNNRSTGPYKKKKTCQLFEGSFWCNREKLRDMNFWNPTLQKDLADGIKTGDLSTFARHFEEGMKTRS